MKKFLSIFLIIIFIFTLSGCKEQETDEDYYKVTFKVDGEVYKTIKVKENDPVSPVVAPTKNNLIFSFWSQVGSSKPYDFEKPVTRNFTLNANYEIASSAINEVTMNYLHGIFTVKVEFVKENKLWFIPISEEITTQQGSAVAIGSSILGFCFLTNSHVVNTLAEYDKRSIKIEDAWGKTYSVDLVQVDPSYDLALLQCGIFSNAGLKEKNIPYFTLANEDPKVNDPVIALGTPKGQKNTITSGKIQSYDTITLTTQNEKTSNVTFPVIVHNAYIGSGSSGGALINSDYELVGINYAARQTDEQFSGRCYSIPASKIREFFDKYELNDYLVLTN
ncbi:MAG: trypsin-like peptidase domain-containing protein [Bacilli bacterium]|nr:trypsin-like peptidase domain-containing protein [Bacilli bacterium]